MTSRSIDRGRTVQFNITEALRNPLMQHRMSENLEKFPCDPPPLYDTVQGQSFEDAEKGNVDTFTGKESPDVLASGDPPPYKQEEFPSKSISSFNHLPPLIMRPWQSFFRTCLKCHWSVSADNFLYNLNYYQINYAWIMVTFVIIALVQIHSDDFRLCILWSSISVLVVHLLNLSGFVPRLFGRRLLISEQLVTVIIFELLVYGLFPGAVTFIYFIVLYCGFVVAHACLTPAKKAVWQNFEIQHV